MATHVIAMGKPIFSLILLTMIIICAVDDAPVLR